MATKKASTKKVLARLPAASKAASRKTPAKGAPKAKAAASSSRAAKPKSFAVERATKKDASPKAAPAAKAKAKAKADRETSVGLDVGDSAPGFVLQDHTGALVSSETLRGSPYIIYFYPKDDTPGCTLQACGFRDALPRFSAKGVHIVGVSPDTKESHARFRQKYELTFPLLSDPEKTLTKAYGVWVKKQNYGREYMGVQRSTFYVDRHGVIRKVWRSVRVPGHVDEVVHSV